jgi:hypothetical protein
VQVVVTDPTKLQAIRDREEDIMKERIDMMMKVTCACAPRRGCACGVMIDARQALIGADRCELLCDAASHHEHGSRSIVAGVLPPKQC